MFYGPECVLSWGMFHVSLKAVCILLFLDGVFYKCQLDQLIDHSGQLYPSECSAHLIYQFLKRCVKVSNYNTAFFYFSSKFCQFLPYQFWCAVVRYIYFRIMSFGEWGVLLLCSAPLYPWQFLLFWCLLCLNIIQLSWLSFD